MRRKPKHKKAIEPQGIATNKHTNNNSESNGKKEISKFPILSEVKKEVVSLTPFNRIVDIVAFVLGFSFLYSSAPILYRLVLIFFFCVLIITSIIVYKEHRKIYLIVGVIATILIGTWVYTEIVQKKRSDQLKQSEIVSDRRRTPIFEKEDPGYKILILPFRTYDEGSKQDIGLILKDRLIDLKKKDSLDFKLVYWDDYSGWINEDSVEIWKKFHNANLIIYGRYINKEQVTQKGLIILKYISDNINDLGSITKRTESAEFTPITLAALALGDNEVQGPYEFIIQWVAGMNEYTNKNYKAAISRLSKVKNTFEIDKVYSLIGNCYGELGDYINQLKYSNLALEVNPNSVSAHYNLALAYDALKQYAQRDKEYHIITRLDAINSNDLGNRAYIKFRLKDYQGTIQDYTKAININPDNPILYNNRGVTYFQLEDYENAIKEYNVAINLSPNEYFLYVNRGCANTKIKNNENALLDFTTAIERNPKNSVAFAYRGVVRMARLEYSASMKDIKQAIELDSNNAEAHLYLADLMFTLKDYKYSINEYTKAIQLNPTASAYFRRAACEYFVKAFKYAIIDYSKSLELDPKLNRFVYAERGMCKYQIGDVRGGNSDYVKAINLTPKDSSLLFTSGILKMEARDYKNAIVEFNRAIKLGYKSEDIYTNRGICEDRINLTEAALNDYNIGIKMNHRNSVAYFYMGQLKFYSKDYIQSLQNVTQALNIWPKYIFALILRIRINIEIKNIEAVRRDIALLSTLSQNDLEAFMNSSHYKFGIKETYQFNHFGKNINPMIDLQKCINKWIGLGFYEIGEYEKAALFFLKGINLYDNSWYSYLGAATAYYRMNEKAKAMNYFKIAVNSEPRINRELKSNELLGEWEYSMPSSFSKAIITMAKELGGKNTLPRSVLKTKDDWNKK